MEKLLERIMGILSNLFRSGSDKDAAQDQSLAALTQRVAALEQGGSGSGAGETALSALAALTSAVQAIDARLTAVEQEIEDVRALATGGTGGTSGDGGTVTVPEIK